MTVPEFRSVRFCTPCRVVYVAGRGGRLGRAAPQLVFHCPTLQRLASEESLGRLVNLAPRFACQALDLDRAMLLHVSGNNIVSGTAWWGGDVVAASDFA